MLKQSLQASTKLIEKMSKKGWTCTDPNILRFAKVDNHDDLYWDICQVDMNRLKSKESEITIFDLSDSLVCDTFGFLSDENLMEKADYYGIPNIREHEKSKLAMLTAEQIFEETYSLTSHSS